ncbi:hypothetical protein K435DRAFT_873540 [Dendrothele bispora CBS 962.96]|uniref:Uncharacterized protein n=1 Tax=Dendrothele bispora (strain CBS 962.96) TaxID=1314807 RepID=A0A4S8KZA4_DENBC|nr:hypothetical protein K435DRAFT_873540 [Dendrothele bispora CBS 962.96]
MYSAGWMAIPVLKQDSKYNGRHCSGMQVPLHLAWAVTAHKSQGLTMSKVQIGSGEKEFCVDLTFEGQEHEHENEDLNVETSFDVLEKEIHAEDDLFKDVEMDLDLAEADILDRRLYDFKELESVDKGVEPKGFEDEIEGSTESTWSVQGIMHTSDL